MFVARTSQYKEIVLTGRLKHPIAFLRGIEIIFLRRGLYFTMLQYGEYATDIGAAGAVNVPS